MRYRNLQNALAELLALGVVPIVNENDSVSVRELEGAFGDNDELSALLATAVKADWLLLLTNVDGFFETRHGQEKSQLVRVVRKLTPALEAQCNGKSTLGRGGMISKLRAAKLASEAGVHVAIVNGRHPQRNHIGDGAQDWNLFSSGARKKMMATSVTNAASTQEKLLRARGGCREAGTAFQRREKCAVAAMANAIEANVEEILRRTGRIWKVPDSKAPCATGCC